MGTHRGHRLEYVTVRNRVPLLAAVTLLMVVAASALTRSPRAAAAASSPVIVGLFTSEGCSDCPAADVLLQTLIASRPGDVEVIGLGEHVDYWDRLGWRDRFSSAALTSRQRDYQSRFGTESIYTPQMVVDGKAEFVGSDAAGAPRAVDRAAAAAHGVLRIGLEPVGARDAERIRVQVDARELPKTGRGDRADIVVAITEDGLRNQVKGGENRGRTLVHAAVVRYLRPIGEASSDGVASAHVEVPISADWQRDQLHVVAFVQEQRARTILASSAAWLKNAQR